jgi:hypothetical protein
MAIGDSTKYPTLQNVTDLFRSQVNDDFQGATDTPGEGLINYNTAPHVLVFLNSAVRDLYSDLRNVGDPELLLDNYILRGIPALASPDPTIQVSLDTVGYYDGQTFNSDYTLPAGCMKVERIWERHNSGDVSQNAFIPMTKAQFGIAGITQGPRMGVWEMRENAVWMPGCLETFDLRLRCRITFPDYLNADTLDFATTYIPILDCTNAVVDKMAVRYARRFAPDVYQVSVDAADKSLFKLKLEVTRNMQSTEYQRITYGDEALNSIVTSSLSQM